MHPYVKILNSNGYIQPKEKYHGYIHIEFNQIHGCNHVENMYGCIHVISLNCIWIQPCTHGYFHAYGNGCIHIFLTTYGYNHRVQLIDGCIHVYEKWIHPLIWMQPCIDNNRNM